jgi:glutaconate CoA-transferase subunit B
MSADSTSATYTSEEMMAVAAARQFRDGATCFVGVGLPSVAACLAREVHAPNIALIYESGAIGAHPTWPPLSIADPQLAETAVSLVTVPEIFSYWIQSGRIDIGFLGAAQIDRLANLNSTVIGNYDSPKLRLPGAGGAPDIAANARELVVIVRQSLKAFVSRLDFLTTPRSAQRTTVVTDLGILETCGPCGELVLTSIHPGVSTDKVREATGWSLTIADDPGQTPEPSSRELSVLRELNR